MDGDTTPKDTPKINILRELHLLLTQDAPPELLAADAQNPRRAKADATLFAGGFAVSLALLLFVVIHIVTLPAAKPPRPARPAAARGQTVGMVHPQGGNLQQLAGGAA